MRQCVEEYKLPSRIYDEWRMLVGVPLMRQMEIIFPDRTEEFWLEVATRYRGIYDVNAIAFCPLFPTLIDTLNSLREANVKITIASSKRRHLVEEVLNHHSLSHYFALIVGAQDVVNHKPHPESVHLTLQQMSTAKIDAVVIGDSTYDLDMARNAGV